jgi:hypothetical protein
MEEEKGIPKMSVIALKTICLTKNSEKYEL